MYLPVVRGSRVGNRAAARIENPPYSARLPGIQLAGGAGGMRGKARSNRKIRQIVLDGPIEVQLTLLGQLQGRHRVEQLGDPADAIADFGGCLDLVGDIRVAEPFGSDQGLALHQGDARALNLDFPHFIGDQLPQGRPDGLGITPREFARTGGQYKPAGSGQRPSPSPTRTLVCRNEKSSSTVWLAWKSSKFPILSLLRLGQGRRLLRPPRQLAFRRPARLPGGPLTTGPDFARPAWLAEPGRWPAGTARRDRCLRDPARPPRCWR